MNQSRDRDKDQSDEFRWAAAAAGAAAERFGQDTVLIDVSGVLAVCDLFVVTSGANPRQIKAICEAVTAGVSAAGGPRPTSVEGLGARSWVLLDFGDFVVHVFSAEDREYYQLERLWGDCPRLNWESEVAAEAS